MGKDEPVEEVQVEESEEPSYYETYWAQNTTAHGVSRVANTHKWHRVVWIAALLGNVSLANA